MQGYDGFSNPVHCITVASLSIVNVNNVRSLSRPVCPLIRRLVCAFCVCRCGSSEAVKGQRKKPRFYINEQRGSDLGAQMQMVRVFKSLMFFPFDYSFPACVSVMESRISGHSHQTQRVAVMWFKLLQMVFHFKRSNFFGLFGCQSIRRPLQAVATLPPLCLNWE